MASGSFTCSRSFRGPTQKSGLTTAHLKPTNLPLKSWLCPGQLRWLSGLAVTDSSHSGHRYRWLPPPLRSTDVVHKLQKWLRVDEHTSVLPSTLNRSRVPPQLPSQGGTRYRMKAIRRPSSSSSWQSRASATVQRTP